MTIPLSETETLARILAEQPDVQFAVLVGSRATGTAGPHSDWDIAMQWAPQGDWLSVLGSTETLRHSLAEALRISPSDIDLIDLRRANLAMRASVAEEGLPLAGQDTLAWAHFLLRTWRELEDFYWDRRHAVISTRPRQPVGWAKQRVPIGGRDAQPVMGTAVAFAHPTVQVIPGRPHAETRRGCVVARRRPSRHYPPEAPVPLA